MANWQEQLQDIYIARAFDLEKVKNASAKQISRTLDDLIREIVREVESADIMGVKRTAYQQERMNKLFNMADKTIKSQFKLIAGSVTGELLTLAEIESMFAAKAINSVLQVNIVDYALSREVLESLAKDTLIQGAPSEIWWSKQASSLQDEFKRVMRVSVARGETLGQMTARIKGTQDITKLGVKGKVPGVTDEMLRAALGEPGMAKKAARNARALVKSSYQAVMSEARMEVYKRNDDVIKGVEFFATLDNRTTLQCRAFDGAQWSNDGKPIGNTRLPFRTPPIHWGAIKEGTLISTNRGRVPVENIVNGDLVLTHCGRFRPVYATMSKGNEFGVLRVIKFKSGTSICLTDGHPVLIQVSGGCDWVRADNVKVGDKLFEHVENLLPRMADGIIPISTTQSCPPLLCEDDVTFSVSAGEVVTAAAVDFKNNFLIDKNKIANIGFNNKLSCWNNIPVLRNIPKFGFSLCRSFYKSTMNFFASGRNALRKLVSIIRGHSVGSPCVEGVSFFGHAVSPVPLAAKLSSGVLTSHIQAGSLNPASGFDSMSNTPLLNNCFSNSMLSFNLPKRFTQFKMFFVNNILNNGFVRIIKSIFNRVVNSNISSVQKLIKCAGFYANSFSDLCNRLFVTKVFSLNKLSNGGLVSKCGIKPHSWLLSEVEDISIVAHSTKIYNLAVEEDESYVANGIIVHNCRSILIPIMRGLDEILGIEGIPPIPPSTRSAFSETGMRGQVSGTTNFDGFMKSLSREEGSKVIGKKRYDLWNSGKLSLQDMLNSEGNVMSLKALQEKTEKGLFWAD